MRTLLTPVLLAAALAGPAGFACAQTTPGPDGSATIDGTGAGLNAGVGATGSGTPRRDDKAGAPATNKPSHAGGDTRVLGAGPRPPGYVVPDNLPGTMDPRNATVGVNGTGRLDGALPMDDTDLQR